MNEISCNVDPFDPLLFVRYQFFRVTDLTMNFRPIFVWQTNHEFKTNFHVTYSPWATITPRAPPPQLRGTMIFRSSEVSHWRKKMFPEKIFGRVCRTRAILIPYGKEIANFWIFQLFSFPRLEFYYTCLNIYEYGIKLKLRVWPFR